MEEDDNWVSIQICTYKLLKKSNKNERMKIYNFAKLGEFLRFQCIISVF